MTRHNEMHGRNIEIYAMHSSGAKLRDIASKHHLSSERIRQIVLRVNVLRELEKIWAEPATDQTLIADIAVSFRTYRALRDGGISTIGDYKKANRKQIARIRNLGLKSFNEAEAFIADRQPVNLSDYMRLLRGPLSTGGPDHPLR